MPKNYMPKILGARLRGDAGPFQPGCMPAYLCDGGPYYCDAKHGAWRPLHAPLCAGADHVRFKGAAMPVAWYLGGEPAISPPSSLVAMLLLHGLAIPNTAMTLFNTCIRNVLCFGAQVWSTYSLPHL